MTDVPFVTVLIPARNERRDLGSCLDAVLAQDHPHDRMEVVVVDGGSTDGTASAAEACLASGDVAFRIVDNPVGTTPSNLNAGLAVAGGDLVCRVDARSIIPADYVRRCAEVLTVRPDVVVTGGAQRATAGGGGPRAEGIARALNNRWVNGGSRYRSGGTSGETDTVYLGAFRHTDLVAVGGWDEYFRTNQDFDLNRRLAAHGTVWFDARLEVDYVPRDSIRKLFSQYHRFGRWKVRYWRRTGRAPEARQRRLLAIGPVAVAAGLAVLVPRRHRVRRLVATGCAAVATVGVLEVTGSSGPRTDVIGHAWGSLAAVAVGVGWLSGAARESLSSDRPDP